MSNWRISGTAAALALVAAASPAVGETRTEIVIDDSGVFPENLTSSRDGTVWIGSLAKGAVYRAAPGAPRATVWLAPGTAGLKRVMGLAADERRGLLWVCDSGAQAKDNGGVALPSTIRTFDLGSRQLRGSYALEGGGTCNDMALAADGTVYATDFDGGRVLRLAKGDKSFKPWATGAALASADGIALLADGAVYVNGFRTGALFRIPVQRDGSAGTPEPIATDRPLVRPDGMRAAGRNILLVVEGEGRLAKLTIDGASARVDTLRKGFTESPAGVTLVGDTAFVVQAKFAFLRDRSKDPGTFSAIAVPGVGAQR